MWHYKTGIWNRCITHTNTHTHTHTHTPHYNSTLNRHTLCINYDGLAASSQFYDGFLSDLEILQVDVKSSHTANTHSQYEMQRWELTRNTKPIIQTPHSTQRYMHLWIVGFKARFSKMCTGMQFRFLELQLMGKVVVLPIAKVSACDMMSRIIDLTQLIFYLWFIKLNDMFYTAYRALAIFVIRIAHELTVGFFSDYMSKEPCVSCPISPISEWYVPLYLWPMVF